MGDLGLTITQGGETAVVIIAVGLFLKYVAQGVAKLRQSRRQPREDDRPKPVPDAVKTSATLLDALEQERTENRRLHEHIDELEAEVDELRDQLFTQRSEYEQQLTDLRRQLESMTNQLDALQARIQQGGTPA